MELNEFNYSFFKSETGQDSNSQTVTIKIADNKLSIDKKWGGYMPSGGHRPIPNDDKYDLDTNAINKILNYLQENELTKSKSEELSVDSLDELKYNSFGQSLKYTINNEPVEISFLYKTNGPKIDEFEQKKLNKDLDGLKKVLAEAAGLHASQLAF